MTKFIFHIALIGFFVSCTKGISSPPVANFSFPNDTISVLKMATYDECRLVNTSSNTDSTLWDLGDGRISRDRDINLSYPRSGKYQVTLFAFKKGVKTSTSKQVIILDRVLKKIVF